MKQKLSVKSLDRFPGTKSKRGKEYPDLVARCYSYGSQILEIANDHWRDGVPQFIYENDWIPSKLAALVLGVSKQAISDRIKRKTLESREGRFGCGVKLVRLMDCRRKKRAGRPKGSTAVKVKELKKADHQTDIGDFCDAGTAALPYACCGNCNSQTSDLMCAITPSKRAEDHMTCKLFMHWDPAKRFNGQ